MACREKYLLGPAEMKLALSTFPEASTRTFIRILMVPLIVFCADLETTGETCCRTPPGLAFPADGVPATRSRSGRRSRSPGTLALTARSRRRRFGCIRGAAPPLARRSGISGEATGCRRNRWRRGNRTRWLSVGTRGSAAWDRCQQRPRNQYHSRDKKNIAPLRGPRRYPDR